MKCDHHFDISGHVITRSPDVLFQPIIHDERLSVMRVSGGYQAV
jgi:hypothetical protein